MNAFGSNIPLFISYDEPPLNKDTQPPARSPLHLPTPPLSPESSLPGSPISASALPKILLPALPPGVPRQSRHFLDDFSDSEDDADVTMNDSRRDGGGDRESQFKGEGEDEAERVRESLHPCKFLSCFLI